MADDCRNQVKEIVVDLLNVDDFVIIKGHPCKIIEKEKGLYGKYCIPKIKLVGIEIFSNKKFEETIKSGKTVQTPTFSTTHWKVLNLNFDGFLLLQDAKGRLKEDLRIPPDHIGSNLRCLLDKKSLFTCTVLQFMDTERVIGLNERV